MFAQFSNLLELLDYFKDQETCMKYWEQIRWYGEITCVHCGATNPYRTNRGFKCSAPACHKKFSAFVGTVFENTKIPLRSWFAAIYLTSSQKKGVSSLQLSRDLSLSQKTAWYLLHRIRQAFMADIPERVNGTIEVDETFVGGKNKNRHWDKKVPHSEGRSHIDKTPVLGILQQDGELRCFVVPDTKAATIQPIIRAHVEKGSTIYSDEWWAYKGLNKDYDHQYIDHGRKQYKNGPVCTNTVEGAWSHFKRMIIGIYHWVSKRHLQRYCDEFCFRYNNRKLADAEKFIIALRKCRNTNLLYKVLTG
jgi:transposase-like protein